MFHDVFLSYSSKDRLGANAACNVLEKNGIRVWMAPRDILPGMSWPGSIIQAINSTRIMILIVSSNVNASPHIEREVERAINKGVPVLPFRVEDVKLNDALEYFISTPHWLDAFDPPLEQHLESLVEAVRQLLATAYIRRDGPGTASVEPNMRDREAEAKEDSEVVATVDAADEPTRASPKITKRPLVTTDEDNPAIETTVEAFRTLGHGSAVLSVAFAPDGKTTLAAATNGIAKLWDVTRGDTLRWLNGRVSWMYTKAHTDRVTCVAFVPDGKAALTGSDDKTLKLWDCATGQVIRTFGGHLAEVRSLAVLPDGKTMLSASLDRTLKLWDLASGHLLQTISGHVKGVSSVAITADGGSALSADQDGNYKLWELRSGRELRAFARPVGWHRPLTITPNGEAALSEGEDFTVELWDLGSGDPLRSFKGHTSNVTAVALAPDGKTALSGSMDHTLKQWDVASGRALRTFVGHKGSVVSVAISLDGKTALSGSWDNTVKLWNLA